MPDNGLGVNMNLNSLPPLGATTALHELSAASILSNGEQTATDGFVCGFELNMLTCDVATLAALNKAAGNNMLSEVNSLNTAAMHQLMAAAAVQSGRRSLDTQLKRLENPAIASARCVLFS